MITIDGIQIDLVGDINSLSCEWAVFTVEFEYDSKLIVCHTLNKSVYRGIKGLIYSVLSLRTKSIELRQALLNSKYITVNIVESGLSGQHDVLALKYATIKLNKTYLPYGHNALYYIGNSVEQNYANVLINEIIDEIDNNAAYPVRSTILRKGRASKRVYSYDKTTGLPVGEYASAKDASENTGICVSNINMCCNGHIRTAGNLMWSYIKAPILDIYSTSTKRQNDSKLLTEAELLERQKDFIQKYQK